MTAALIVSLVLLIVAATLDARSRSNLRAALHLARQRVVMWQRMHDVEADARDDLYRAFLESDAENDALRAERDVLYIEIGLLRARVVRRAAPFRIRRSDLPRLRRVATEMTVRLAESTADPQTDEARADAETTLRVLHEVIGERQ